MMLFKDNLISAEISFPNIKNNYKGADIEPFVLPSDMPSRIEYSALNIRDVIPLISLKTRKLSSGQKIFINIVQHKDIPVNTVTAIPYVFLTNIRTFVDQKSDEEGIICDIGIHTSAWANQEQVCYCI